MIRKKIIAALTAVLMLMLSASTVLAANSPIPEGTTPESLMPQSFMAGFEAGGDAVGGAVSGSLISGDGLAAASERIAADYVGRNPMIVAAFSGMTEYDDTASPIRRVGCFFSMMADSGYGHRGITIYENAGGWTRCANAWATSIGQWACSVVGDRTVGSSEFVVVSYDYDLGSNSTNHLYADGATPETLAAAVTTADVDGTGVSPRALLSTTLDQIENEIKGDMDGTYTARIIAAADIDYAGGGRLTLHMADIRAGGSYLVYHLPNGANKCEVLVPDSVVDGSLSVTVGSFSPFVIVERTAVSSSDDHYHYWQERRVDPTPTTWGYTMYYCAECGATYADNYIAPGGSRTTEAADKAVVTSPKTDESGMPMVLLVMAGALAGGAAVCAKRGFYR